MASTPIASTSRPAPATAAVRRLATAAFGEVRLMLARWRERRVLGEMDARALRDLGITPHEAGTEARKPFWQG